MSSNLPNEPVIDDQGRIDVGTLPPYGRYSFTVEPPRLADQHHEYRLGKDLLVYEGDHEVTAGEGILASQCDRVSTALNSDTWRMHCYEGAQVDFGGLR